MTSRALHGQIMSCELKPGVMCAQRQSTNSTGLMVRTTCPFAGSLATGHLCGDRVWVVAHEHYTPNTYIALIDYSKLPDELVLQISFTELSVFSYFVFDREAPMREVSE